MIIIGGVTASGKTKTAALVAQKLQINNLISADSMQIYKGFNIGTAKESDENLGLKQYMVDVAEKKDSFSVFQYRQKAETIIQKLQKEQKHILVAGGTGLYINSLIFENDYGKGSKSQSSDDSDNDANSGIDISLREKLQLKLDTEGKESLYAELIRIDPLSAKKIHMNNTKRVLRALEVMISTGKSISEVNKKTVRNFMLFVLSGNRETLNKRINERVDIMFENGLKNEVEELLDEGLTFENQSMLGIGYKEWYGYFIDKTLSDNQVKELIQKNTRAYGKRQQTWFLNQYQSNNCVILNATDMLPEDMANEIVNRIQQRK